MAWGNGKLPTSMLMVLHAIEGGYDTMAKLSVARGVDIRSMGILLRRLMDDELIEQEVSKGYVRIEITDQGVEALDGWTPK